MFITPMFITYEMRCEILTFDDIIFFLGKWLSL